MNPHIRLIEKKSRTDAEVLVVWTDQQLSREEIQSVAKWLHCEGYTDVPVSCQWSCQCFRKVGTLFTKLGLVSIILFFWSMSMVICYYFFSVS